MTPRDDREALAWGPADVEKWDEESPSRLVLLLILSGVGLLGWVAWFLIGVLLWQVLS